MFGLSQVSIIVDMWNPYHNQINFRLVSFQSIPETYYGVYGIWYRRQCIYVGKAATQTIGERLEQHWKRTHNPRLKAWIDAKGTGLQVSFFAVKERDRIDCTERFYIRRFQPITNDILYENVFCPYKGPICTLERS